MNQLLVDHSNYIASLFILSTYPIGIGLLFFILLLWPMVLVLALALALSSHNTQSQYQLRLCNILQAIIMESPWERHFVWLKTSRSSVKLHSIVKTLEKIGNMYWMKLEG